MARLGARSGGLALGALASACSALIGLDDYAIDPSLDSQGGSAARSAGGGAAQSAGGAAGDGAQAGGVGGEPRETNGGAAGDTSSAGKSGSVSAAGEGGAAGAGGAATDCATLCDDDIDCTVDSCAVDGQCVHAPDSALCDADADECVTCELGIGCVASPATVTQILNDPNLDVNSDDWSEDIRDAELQDFIINPDPAAHSAPNAAWWLPAAADATGQAYADLIQGISLPLQTKALRLSGVYELRPGVIAPNKDYAVAGLFRGATEVLAFHTWRASDGAAPSWTSFEYQASATKLTNLLAMLAEDPDLSITFDIYGEMWDSEFRFDTLSLEAVSCE